MLPKFPNFKLLHASDRQLLQPFISRFQPYSSFNFTNLRAWDLYDDRQFCFLNDNLVLRLSDYHTAKPFLTFLGDRDLERTVKTLLKFTEEQGINSVIRFVTHEAVELIQLPGLRVEEDRTSSDYVYSVERLATLPGQSFKEKRSAARRFEQRYPSATFGVLDQMDGDTEAQFMSVLKQWEKNKTDSGKDFDLRYEQQAIFRIFKCAEAHHEVLFSVVCDQDAVIAFSVDELLPDGHVMAHFIKADTRYQGIYEYVNLRLAQYLHTAGAKWWNWQQDLGLEGLRRVKMSYRPSHFLKKYNISKAEGIV